MRLCMNISYRDAHHPRFLITRLSAVGDCIHSMPLIGALRRRFPGAFIAWATQGLPATLLDNYPGLDQIYRVDRDWLKSLSSVSTVRRELRSFNFDVTLDAQSLTKSAALGWLSGAPYRIGFGKPQGRELSLWLNNIKVKPTVDHVVEKYLQLLEPLGIEIPAAPRFEMAEWQHASMQQFLQEKIGAGRYAVINPGAGWDSKLWPAKRFGEVARYLGQKHQLHSIVVWAGDREESWAHEIVEHAGGQASMAPSTSLPELTSVLRGATLCVAADTGPLHLAAAVNVPCVGLYGPTRPSECGPYGPQHVSVQTYLQGGTGRERRGADNSAMCAIEVSQVEAACDQLLARAQAA